MNLNEVADFFGGKKKLADALGIYPSAVTQWGEIVPLGRQYQIQVLTSGKFKAETAKDCKSSANPLTQD